MKAPKIQGPFFTTDIGPSRAIRRVVGFLGTDGRPLGVKYKLYRRILEVDSAQKLAPDFGTVFSSLFLPDWQLSTFFFRHRRAATPRSSQRSPPNRFHFFPFLFFTPRPEKIGESLGYPAARRSSRLRTDAL